MIVSQACNPTTWEVELGGSGVRAYLLLHSKFEASLAYTKPNSKKKWKEVKERERRGQEGREEEEREKYDNKR